jgi:hypothetical protein
MGYCLAPVDSNSRAHLPVHGRDCADTTHQHGTSFHQEPASFNGQSLTACASIESWSRCLDLERLSERLAAPTRRPAPMRTARRSACAVKGIRHARRLPRNCETRLVNVEAKAVPQGPIAQHAAALKIREHEPRHAIDRNTARERQMLEEVDGDHKSDNQAETRSRPEAPKAHPGACPKFCVRGIA